MPSKLSTGRQPPREGAWFAEFMGAERARFEAFIAGPPFERDVRRFPDDPERYAWPGSYRDINVDLAWQAWIEARVQA